MDVMLPDGHHALVILPAKFRKQIWIRKGGFVIVQVTVDEEDGNGQRSFNGEIVRVLLRDDEKHLRSLEGGAHWPERWSLDDRDGEGEESGEDGEDEEIGGDGEDEEIGGDEEIGEIGEDAQGEATTGVEAGDGREARSESSEDELPAHLQRVSNRRRVPYRDDSSSSESD